MNYPSLNITNWKRTISCYEYSFLELLSVKIKFFENLLTNWRTPVFLKEIKMANVKSKDKVLHIGCGIFPTAAIVIAEKTKAQVVGIDNNKFALKFAKKFIEKKGLSNLIKIDYGDGKNYNVKNFDVIFISINVWPIESVLKHISYNTKKDARVICRGVKKDKENLFENKSIKDLYLIKKKMVNPKTYSFLLSLK